MCRIVTVFLAGVCVCVCACYVTKDGTKEELTESTSDDAYLSGRMLRQVCLDLERGGDKSTLLIPRQMRDERRTFRRHVI